MSRAEVVRLCRAGAAGVVATAALEAGAPLERWVVGGALPFAPDQIASAICQRLELTPSTRTRTAMGRLLRWTYGPGWAVLYGAVRPRLRRSPAGRATLLAATIGTVELVALPFLLGRRLLRARALAALALHVATFAAVVETTLCLVDARARSTTVQ